MSLVASCVQHAGSITLLHPLCDLPPLLLLLLIRTNKESSLHINTKKSANDLLYFNISHAVHIP